MRTRSGADPRANFGADRYRGDVYEVASRTTLTTIESYLNFTGTRTLNYVVFEGTDVTGPFNHIASQTVDRVGTGEGFYSSGPLSVLLEPGKLYIIATGWTGGNVTFYWDTTASPIDVSFGQQVDGYILDSYPIPESVGNPSISSPYYQRLTTEDTWLRSRRRRDRSHLATSRKSP
ncbi:MAG: hypothetical protein R3E12_09240 [Candidatus Eisenbacteria bacterium]